MSNIAQNKISDSMLNKGIEKAKQRPSKKRSKVWGWFTEEPDGSKKAKCNICRELLSCDSRNGTSHLKRHPCYRENQFGYVPYRNTEPSGCQKNHLEYDRKRTTKPSGCQENNLEYDPQRNTEPSGCQENYLVFDPQRNRELFVKMVIDNTSILEHVDNPFLEEFAISLHLLYSHVTRRDVEEDCLTFYKNEIAQLKEKITTLTSKVSLSVMSCYNPKDKSILLCVAAHLIDNKFKLFKRIIGFVEFNAKLGFERILNDWGLCKKAFACTAKSYNFEQAKKFSQTLDVKCILECFLSVADVIYFTIISDRCKIEKIMNDLNIYPEKMCYFNGIAAEHNLAPKLEFLLDERRELGSYLNILNDACTYKNVFCELDDMNVGWSKVAEVVHLLNLINDVNVMLSSLEIPTSNLLLKFVFEISDVLSEASPTLSGDTIDSSLAILDKYLASCDKIVLIASLLDPRFKLRFRERCIGKFIANEEDFNKFFCSLYNEYQSESTEICIFDCLSQIPELNKYFQKRSVEEGDANLEVLSWWKGSESEYPILSRMARDILAIPISSSLTSGTEPVEEIINEIFLSTVDTGMSKILVCCNNWLRSDRSAGIEKRYLDQASPEPLNTSNICVYDHIKCQEVLAKLVISCELPFHFVKSTQFIEWAKNLQPLYTSVDLASIKRKCLGFYQMERQRLNDPYKNTSVNSTHIGRVCFSAHQAGEPGTTYICVTEHFIDDYFNLVRRIIDIKIRNAYSSWSIATLVQRCTDHWEHPKKVLALTSEIFSGLTCGVGAIKLHCIVQGFNVLVKFIWSERLAVIGSIRKMIKFIAEDPNTMLTINQLAIKLKINSPKSYLQLDDERRWDSTLNMLSDALAYKDAIDAYKGYDESFSLCGNWNEVESTVKFLKPIYEAVTILSSSQYPTSNLFLKIVFEIHDVLSHVVFNTNNDYDKGRFLDSLMEISNTFLKDCNNILLVASLLDPRFKSTYLERCYTEHISDKDHVDLYIGDLCNKFAPKHGRGMLELDRYLQKDHRYLQKDHVEVRDGDFDVLRWWKKNQSNYPTLSRIARHILAIPVSSLPSESAFGTEFIRFGKFANQLGPRTMEALVCSYNWLSDASSNGKIVRKEAAIDLVKKHIPPSYKCPLRACDFWSIKFLEHGLSGRMSEEIVAIGGARLTAKNMQCLIKSFDEDEIDRWIPDEVINCYIGIMNNKGITSGKILKLSTFDSQLLQSWGLSMGEREKLCARISNIIEKGNGFLQNELVFLPIHIQNHWFVGALNASKKEFQILNSLNSYGGPYEETTHKLRLGIQLCIAAALDFHDTIQAWRPDINVLDWPISVIPNLPQQKDGCSCGLFALKYMQLWDGSKLATEFTQDDIDLFTKQLVGELIFSELNEMKNIQTEIKKTKLYKKLQESTEPEESEESEEPEELEEST